MLSVSCRCFAFYSSSSAIFCAYCMQINCCIQVVISPIYGFISKAVGGLIYIYNLFYDFYMIMKGKLVALFLSISVGLNSQNILNEEIAYQKADSLIKILTIEQKTSMIRGYNRFFINGIKEKGIPPLYLSDASQGVHIRTNLPQRDLTKQLDRSTAFPAPILLASTFSPELAYKYAEAVGEECRAGGIEILLGPGLNIQRQSQCARNFEYFGEDPYLTSVMVSNYVKGIQSTGTASCLKHFLGNNTEFFRKRSNSVIDERTINEIYLPGFKAGIEAGAMSVMTSYNLINGEWAGQSSYVIKELLRKQLGFKWLVMSDWNSVWDLEKVIKSGQNLEMPGSYDFGESIEDLMAEAKISEREIDEMVRPIFATAYAMGFYDRPKYMPSLLEKFPEHEKVSRKVAEEGIVLLKNNGILPIKNGENKKMLLTGRFVFEIPRGYGSAEVVGYNNVNLLDALKNEYGESVYYIKEPTEKDLKEADIVLLSMGTRDEEAIERPFALPKKSEDFMRFAVRNNPNTIAIINAGSAIDMTGWNDKLAGLIYGWYGGQSGFEALTDIISGKISPSGKLPMTIERSFKDSPAYDYLPKGAQLYNEIKNEQLINVYDVKYDEGVLVGYRWYDTKGISPLYHFGYGLSYSSFELSKPHLSTKKMNKNKAVECSIVIKNTGKYDAAEVVQLYISEERPTVVRPVKELKKFDKIYLNPGEKKTVKFRVDSRDLAFWDINTHSWKTNEGKFNLMIGTSSNNIAYSLPIEFVDVER